VQEIIRLALSTVKSSERKEIVSNQIENHHCDKKQERNVKNGDHGFVYHLFPLAETSVDNPTDHSDMIQRKSVKGPIKNSAT
jgi:hypothetical protein